MLSIYWEPVPNLEVCKREQQFLYVSVLIRVCISVLCHCMVVGVKMGVSSCIPACVCVCVRVCFYDSVYLCCVTVWSCVCKVSSVLPCLRVCVCVWGCVCVCV